MNLFDMVALFTMFLTIINTVMISIIMSIVLADEHEVT